LDRGEVLAELWRQGRVSSAKARRALSSHLDVDTAVGAKNLSNANGALAMAVLISLMPLGLALGGRVPLTTEQDLVIDDAPKDGVSYSTAPFCSNDESSEGRDKLVEEEESGSEDEEGEGKVAAGGFGEGRQATTKEGELVLYA
jgi:hypothetical protein